MLRWYLVIVVMVGVAASMLGHLPSGASTAGAERVIVTRPAGQGSPAGTAAEDSLNPLDHGVVLTRAPNGYFYADVQINNGAPLHMIVDTGATVIALSRDDAEMAGLAVPIGMNDVVGQGADGAVRGQQVLLDHVSF